MPSTVVKVCCIFTAVMAGAVAKDEAHLGVPGFHPGAHSRSSEGSDVLGVAREVKMPSKHFHRYREPPAHQLLAHLSRREFPNDEA